MDEGWVSNIVPSACVSFLSFSQKVYASAVKAICFTNMLYFVSNFSELDAIVGAF
jgi:hypothetical protein